MRIIVSVTSRRFPIQREWGVCNLNAVAQPLNNLGGAYYLRYHNIYSTSRIQEASLGPTSGMLGAAALARGKDGEYVLGGSTRLT